MFFQAIPDTGYSISHWTLNGELLSGHMADSLHMPELEEDLDVGVAFEMFYYQVDYFVDGNHGTLEAHAGETSVHPGDTVQQGQDLLFTATPDDGYRVLQWTLNGEEISNHTDLTYLYKELDQEVDVSVSFEPIYHQVDYYVDGNHGTLEAHTGETPVYPGDEVQQGKNVAFTAEPDPGFRVKAWHQNGALMDDQTGNTFEIISLDDDAMVSVSFEQAVSIGEINEPEINIYPNPAKEHIYVEAGVEVSHIQLMDIRGHIIDEVDVYDHKTSLYIRNLTPGIYLLRIETDEETLHRRVQVVNQR